MAIYASIISYSALVSAAADPPLAWVVESQTYAKSVQQSAPTWRVEWCGANGSQCSPSEMPSVRAVVGRGDAIDLTALPALGLVQSASWYPVDGDAVPTSAIIANFDIWPDPWFQNYSVANLGEFAVAAIFDDTYRLGKRSAPFIDCAFSADSPGRCAAASTATNHATVSSLTIGVLGYGKIGEQVALRMSALGADVIATKKSGPFTPTPPSLRWLSDDNDRLLRESDVVVVTVPGSAAGLINATSLGLMREHALLVPISAGPIDFPALEAALTARPSLRAVIDVWPSGCWGDENALCGPPYGARDWPYGSPALVKLPNVVATPGLAMRDARFWADSAALVGANLEAFAAGKPVTHVVRNASVA